jgi:hypothetical protein
MKSALGCLENGRTLQSGISRKIVGIFKKLRSEAGNEGVFTGRICDGRH